MLARRTLALLLLVAMGSPALVAAEEASDPPATDAPAEEPTTPETSPPAEAEPAESTEPAEAEPAEPVEQEPAVPAEPVDSPTEAAPAPEPTRPRLEPRRGRDLPELGAEGGEGDVDRAGFAQEMESKVRALASRFGGEFRAWKQELRAQWLDEAKQVRAEMRAAVEEARASWEADRADWAATCEASGMDETCEEARAAMNREAHAALRAIEAAGREQAEALNAKFRALVQDKLEEMLLEMRFAVEDAVEQLQEKFGLGPFAAMLQGLGKMGGMGAEGRGGEGLEGGKALPCDGEHDCRPPPECRHREPDAAAGGDAPTASSCMPPGSCKEAEDGTRHCREVRSDGGHCTAEGRCTPPKACAGKVGSSPSCTPPSSCRDTGDGTFQCKSPERSAARRGPSASAGGTRSGPGFDAHADGGFGGSGP